jgi:hypothetical protein
MTQYETARYMPIFRTPEIVSADTSIGARWASYALFGSARGRRSMPSALAHPAQRAAAFSCA